MPRFIHIRTSKFPILEGEESEVFNPGTYGKAFAIYLQENLQKAGYDVPFVCCEDWGWWVELRLPIKTIGLCCHREHDENTECNFVCSTSLESETVWSWKKFRFIKISMELDKLIEDLTEIFERDQQIEFVGVLDEFFYTFESENSSG